jgi:HSP20 family protein
MLERWEPFGSIRKKSDIFGELTRMQQEMNRFFDEFFGDRRSELAEGEWLPAVDVSETETEIVVRAELPGLIQEDIELSLQDNVLTLKGEKKPEKKEQKESYHRTERSYGSFTRAVTLPANVEQSKVQAAFKDGILKITLPKIEEVKPKKIVITAE